MTDNINFENNNGFDIPNFDYNIPASPIRKYSTYKREYLNNLCKACTDVDKIDLKEEIQKYHLTMLGILKHIREHRNQYEHCFGKFIDGMEEVCISELDHSAESIQKINKLINEFKVGEREMTSVTYLPIEMNIRISEGILKNPDFIIECKYSDTEQRKVIVVNKYDPLYSTIKQIFIDDKTQLCKEVK